MRKWILLTGLAVLVGSCVSQPADRGASGAAGMESSSPAPSEALAPAIPDTEIFFLDVERRGGDVRLGDPVNVTNRVGYDNQPQFLPDGSLLYTRMDAGATDIWRVSDRSMPEQLTDTPESEYSPTPLPGGGFSVVRVEEDGTQRLWRFDSEGRRAELVIEDLAPIGYHAWAGPYVATFVLGDPHSLYVSDTRRAGLHQKITEDIGRALIPLGGSGVAFVQKSAEGWWVSVLDAGTGEVRRVAELPVGVEDFTVDPHGSYWTSDSSWILRWNGQIGEWERVRRYVDDGLESVTRMTFSSDGSRMAIVAERRSPTG